MCHSLIARFMGPTWGLPGADRTQVAPMLATWTLLAGCLPFSRITTMASSVGKDPVPTAPAAARHKLSLVQAVSVMAGVMVGSGIFISPVPILLQCGSPALALLVWTLSGLVMLLVALTYTELGAMYPEAGGEYAFFKHILGEFLIQTTHTFIYHFDGLVQDCCNSSALAMELPQSCTKPTIYFQWPCWFFLNVIS